MTGQLNYRRVFDPPMRPAAPTPGEPVGERVGDRTMDRIYVYDDEIVLAVNIALATGRPLLVRGNPGTGKTSLAPNAARQLRRRFYRKTISSRTQARDLLWTIDEVARLSDATGGGQARPRPEYVVPGVLWWTFDPDSARRRGLDAAESTTLPDPNEGTPHAAEAVVLLDEIDKADPDVPNDLLEPLGSYCFRREDGPLVAAPVAPLVVITTNDERELPKAFLRRCVALELQPPDPDRLRDIARAHFPDQTDKLFADILLSFPPAADATDGPKQTGVKVRVSIAEYLDAIAASVNLGIRPGHDLWKAVLRATVHKPTELDQP
ncbi:AAA family ATPase [Kitasatospora sp. NPDC094028]